MMEVVPPQAAARVPVSKVSEALVPPKGSSMWVCASTPPGMTYLPGASIPVSASISPSAVEPGESSATMVSPSTRTSAVVVPVALTTVPFLMRVVMGFSWDGGRAASAASDQSRPGSRRGDPRVGVRAPVAVELPVVAHLPDHVHVQVSHQHLLLVGTAELADEVAPGVDDLAGAVEVDRLVAVLVVLEAHAAGLEHEVADGHGGPRDLALPQPVREPRLGGVG